MSLQEQYEKETGKKGLCQAHVPYKPTLIYLPTVDYAIWLEGKIARLGDAVEYIKPIVESCVYVEDSNRFDEIDEEMLSIIEKALKDRKA